MSGYEGSPMDRPDRTTTPVLVRGTPHSLRL